MNVGGIISDAVAYPFHNIKALLLYVVLSVIAALIAGASLLSIVVALSAKGLGGIALTGLGVAGVLIFIIVLFLIQGYALDIIKFGIERRDDGPGIDIVRQIANAIKLVIVDVVYYIVPVIITAILALFLRDWLITIIAIILFIVFALANFMAKCRLAKTDSLGDALAIGEAIGDISKVGIGPLLAVVILIAIILVIIAFIVALLASLNTTLGSIVLGIAAVYFVFFYNRAIGLLYSNA